MPHWKVNPRAVVWAEADSETVVLELGSEAYLGLNETGAVLWPFLVQGSDEDRLVALLVTGFGCSEATARQDVHAFLEACRRRGLLVAVP